MLSKTRDRGPQRERDRAAGEHRTSGRSVHGRKGSHLSSTAACTADTGSCPPPPAWCTLRPSMARTPSEGMPWTPPASGRPWCWPPAWAATQFARISPRASPACLHQRCSARRRAAPPAAPSGPRKVTRALGVRRATVDACPDSTHCRPARDALRGGGTPRIADPRGRTVSTRLGAMTTVRATRSGVCTISSEPAVLQGLLSIVG